MQVIREQLCAAGHSVTSRWIDGGHQLAVIEISTSARCEEQSRFAREDWDDLVEADCVISFTEPPRELNSSRGGRHVEYGMALALGKKIIVVGFLENVFHHLPEVLFFEDWDQLRWKGIPS